MNSEDQLQRNGMKEDEIRIKHNKEKKDLQAKIMKLKKGVPKGDKRRMKEIKLEISDMENALAEKHKLELEDFNKAAQKNEEIAQINDAISTIEIANNTEECGNKPKVSKAKRKRDRKAAKQKERDENVEIESHKEYLNSQRYKEEELMKKILYKRGLQVKHMKSDGNCLYYAIEDQLKDHDLSSIHTTQDLRNMTAEYMLRHVDEFLPFLTKQDTGDCFTHDEFIKYCDDIKQTCAWGGQLELRALSQVLQLPIHVIQAEAPLVIIGEEFNKKEIILTYHRHQFGLGEHYNSVMTKIEENDPF